MSRSDQAECKGVLIRETANAMLVAAKEGAEEFWIPRAQVGYLRIDRDAEHNSPRITFTCPEWLVESKNAWSLVP